jgi:hypothetical protein
MSMYEKDVVSAPRPKKARKISLAEATVRAPRPFLGLLSNGRGKIPQGYKHPGVPAHVMKAVEARRKFTLTGTRT